MARSRPGARARPSAPPPADAPGLASATRPRVWQGVGYRPLVDAAAARGLFDFAALPWPTGAAPAFGWGAWRAGSGPGDGGEELIGAVVAQRDGEALMLHGPVVIREDDAFEVAAQLVAAALEHAAALGTVTVFARPLGLDRVWVRFGFIPIPESALPAALAGPRGGGLYGWRGGTALWTPREAASH